MSEKASYSYQINNDSVFFREEEQGGSMKNMNSYYRILRGVAKRALRVFTIVRTRKIYGYNSVAERILRHLFRRRRVLIAARRNQD
jgi:hypothetical protein